MKNNYKSTIFIFLLFVILLNSCAASTKKRIDCSPEISDDRLIEIIKETANFMDSGIELSDDVAYWESDNYDDYYFKSPEVEEKLYIYHREYIKDKAYDYMCEMYNIRKYAGGLAKSDSYESELNSYLRYKIDTNGEFSIKQRSKESICIQAWFKKSPVLGSNMPEYSIGEIYVELCEDNKWRISKITQWYNDLAYYELGYIIDYFFSPEYSTQKDYEEFIAEYGYDSNGKQISMNLDRDIDRDEILVGSNTGLISQSVNLKKLQNLSKLSAHMACEEIYARHGKIYEDHSPEYYYFHRQSWYKENQKFDKDNLSAIEKENIKVIREYINSSF